MRSARLPLRAYSGRMLSRCSWPTSICGPELRAASRPPLDQDSRTLNYLDIQKTVLSVHASLFRAIIGLCAVTMVDRPPPNLQARCSSHKHGGARLITRRPLSGSSRECLWFAAKTGGRAIPRRHSRPRHAGAHFNGKDSVVEPYRGPLLDVPPGQTGNNPVG